MDLLLISLIKKILLKVKVGLWTWIYRGKNLCPDYLEEL